MAGDIPSPSPVGVFKSVGVGTDLAHMGVLKFLKPSPEA